MVAAIFIGLFTIIIGSLPTSSKLESFYLILLSVQISIITLLIWRYYSHYIDNELVFSYKQTLFCEEKLEIPFEISIASWLEKNIVFELPPPYKNSVELSRKKKYLEQNDTMKNKIIRTLIERNRSGYRFHNIWDKVAAYSAVGIWLFQLILIISNLGATYLDFTSIIILIVILPAGYFGMFWALTKDLKNNITIQRDPTNIELENIIDQIAKQ